MQKKDKKSGMFSIKTFHWFCFSFCVIAESANCSPCYPAVFSFGDSLYDTGNGIKSGNVLALLFSPNVRPYGETYFGQPANRYSDGRLMIDFLVQSLGLPFLQPYLSITSLDGAQFSQGVNYAVAGSYANKFSYLVSKGVITVLTPLSLDVQLSWHQKIIRTITSGHEIAANLPKESDLSKALYILEIGGNDYGAFILSRRSISQIQAEVLPRVIQNITNAVEILYQNAARNFLIQGLTPEGCAPLYLIASNTSMFDSNGCREDLNQLNIAHDTQLRAAIQSLREKYTDISISFADMLGAYINIIENPSLYGFTETLNACCGAGPGFRYNFAYRRICGRRSTYLCSDPSTHVVWDGIHPTDAFNRQVVNKFIAGEFLDPPNGLACASQILN